MISIFIYLCNRFHYSEQSFTILTSTPSKTRNELQLLQLVREKVLIRDVEQARASLSNLGMMFTASGSVDVITVDHHAWVCKLFTY